MTTYRIMMHEDMERCYRDRIKESELSAAWAEAEEDFPDAQLWVEDEIPERGYGY